MREAKKIEPETFRRMLRERQGICMECREEVEAVDRFHRPGMSRFDRLVIWCPHCKECPAVGILQAKQSGYVEYEREPGRGEKEIELFEGMPASHEGRDECWYVWVDGDFENVEAMSNARLDALLARMKLFDEQDRQKIQRDVASENERVRRIWNSLAAPSFDVELSSPAELIAEVSRGS